MKTDQIIMCVVALLLGMLLANMLKNVCGCKIVEGQGQLGTIAGGEAAMLAKAARAADNAWSDGLCQFERASTRAYSTLDPGPEYDNWARNLVMKDAMRDEIYREDTTVEMKRTLCEWPSGPLKSQGGPSCVWTTKEAVKAGEDCYEPLPVVHMKINPPPGSAYQQAVQVMADLDGTAEWIISRLESVGEAERAALNFLGYTEHLKQLGSGTTNEELPQVKIELTWPTVNMPSIDDKVQTSVIMAAQEDIAAFLMPHIQTIPTPEERKVLLP